jgi:uncharacterized FAD-dependent dehydrogenase
MERVRQGRRARGDPVRRKPHIGTFKLVKVVENMRAQIVALGGEIRFEQRVTDVHIEDGEAQQLRGLTLDQATGEQLRADHVVLALGHSARDTFAMLHAARRVHGGQALLDRLSHRAPAGRDRPRALGPPRRQPLLGAADYKLVHHASNGRSVYSFCMCPGGTVVAATSEPAAS